MSGPAILIQTQSGYSSGINAIAHAVEALYSVDSNPMMDLFALHGIRTIAQSLPLIAKNPHDRDARSDALFGAWACGVCLGSVGMALHHKVVCSFHCFVSFVIDQLFKFSRHER
jgi:maleylacetate reductase